MNSQNAEAFRSLPLILGLKNILVFHTDYVLLNAREDDKVLEDHKLREEGKKLVLNISVTW